MEDYIPIAAEEFIRRRRADARDAAQADRLRAEMQKILDGLEKNDSLSPMLRGLLRARLTPSYFSDRAERTLKNVYKELALRKEEAAELESARRWLAEERETAGKALSGIEKEIMEHLISGFRRWYSLRFGKKLRNSDQLPDTTQNRMMFLPPREFIGALKKIGAYPRETKPAALAVAV